MSALDLLEDGFPHSTPEGYAHGCRGSHCPGIEEFGWSCTFAKQQEASDYHWRSWFAEGRSPAEIRELRKEFEMSEKKAKPRPVPNPAEAVRPVVELDDALAAEIEEGRHGTIAGYQRGCRGDGCPNLLTGGMSCQEASQQYHRELRARKRAEGQETVKAPASKRARELLEQAEAAEEPKLSESQDPYIADSDTSGAYDDTDWDDPAEPAAVEVDSPRWEEVCAQLNQQIMERDDLLAEAQKQLQDANGGLARAGDRIASLLLELDVAKSQASTRPQFVVSEMVAVREDPRVTIEPLSGGGVRLLLEGAAVSAHVRFDADGALDVAIGA